MNTARPHPHPPPLTHHHRALRSGLGFRGYCNRITAALKDSSPGQKPPPPHAQPTVWQDEGGLGGCVCVCVWGWGLLKQVVLHQHFKAARLSIIRSRVPSSRRAGHHVERLRMTSPCSGASARTIRRRRAPCSHFSTLPISLTAFLQRSSTYVCLW